MNTTICLIIITVVAVISCISITIEAWKVLKQRDTFKFENEVLKTEKEVLKEEIKSLRQELELEKQISKAETKLVSKEKTSKPRTGRPRKSTK